MNVSKSAWHYKLVEIFYESMPVTTCQYITAVIATIVRIIAVLIGILLVGFGTGSALHRYIGFATDSLGWFDFIATTMIGMLFIALLVIVVFGIVLAINKIKDFMIDSSHKDNIVATAFKQHKEKYCTLVEYKDDATEK